MDRPTALLVSSSLSYQSAYYKSMDITSQMTQLNALTKYHLLMPEGTRKISLDKCIKRRQIRLQLSLDALCILESDWIFEVPGMDDPLVSKS